jgi:transcriptional regulator with XRE-family HTH domain
MCILLLSSSQTMYETAHSTTAPDERLTPRPIEVAANLRRLMARRGLRLVDLVMRSGLDDRTVKSVLAARGRPHARTLFKLAQGLEVPADELLERHAGGAAQRARLFDRRTNPVVDEVVCAEPALFAGWTPAEFDELYSRFGTGGALVEEGVRAAAQQINQQRDIHRQVAVILETDQRDVLIGVVKVLFQKISLLPPPG